LFSFCFAFDRIGYFTVSFRTNLEGRDIAHKFNHCVRVLSPKLIVSYILGNGW
jgi:hypothetical protein